MNRKIFAGTRSHYILVFMDCVKGFECRHDNKWIRIRSITILAQNSPTPHTMWTFYSVGQTKTYPYNLGSADYVTIFAFFTWKIWWEFTLQRVNMSYLKKMAFNESISLHMLAEFQWRATKWVQSVFVFIPSRFPWNQPSRRRSWVGLFSFTGYRANVWSVLWSVLANFTIVLLHFTT